MCWNRIKHQTHKLDPRSYGNYGTSALFGIRPQSLFSPPNPARNPDLDFPRPRLSLDTSLTSTARILQMKGAKPICLLITRPTDLQPRNHQTRYPEPWSCSLCPVIERQTNKNQHQPDQYGSALPNGNICVLLCVLGLECRSARMVKYQFHRDFLLKLHISFCRSILCVSGFEVCQPQLILPLMRALMSLGAFGHHPKWYL